MYRFLEAIHPLKTAETVAFEIGISPDAVRKWSRGESAPSLPVVLLLMERYGPQILVEFYGSDGVPDWIEDARDRAELADIRAMGQALMQRIACLESRDR